MVLVVKIGALVASKGTGGTEGGRGSNIAMDVGVLFVGFTTIPDLLGTGGNYTAGDSSDDLLLLTQNTLARPLFLLVVDAARFPTMARSFIIRATRIVVVVIVMARLGGPCAANISCIARRREVASYLLDGEVAVLTSARHKGIAARGVYSIVGLLGFDVARLCSLSAIFVIAARMMLTMVFARRCVVWVVGRHDDV
jgi:hypothetical protein